MQYPQPEGKIFTEVGPLNYKMTGNRVWFYADKKGIAVSRVPLEVRVELAFDESQKKWDLHPQMALQVCRVDSPLAPTQTMIKKISKAIVKGWNEFVTPELHRQARQYALDAAINRKLNEIKELEEQVQDIKTEILDLKRDLLNT